MRYEYEFDFGANPSFVIDAWFLRAIRPIFILCLILFPLSAFSGFWVGRYVIPAIAVGALTVFFGVYLYRRNVARRRVAALADPVFHYLIDDTGIHFENEVGSGVIKWGFRGSLVRVRGFVLLKSGEVGLLPLPGDAPAELLDFVRAQIKR